MDIVWNALNGMENSGPPAAFQKSLPTANFGMLTAEWKNFQRYYCLPWSSMLSSTDHKICFADVVFDMRTGEVTCKPERMFSLAGRDVAK